MGDPDTLLQSTTNQSKSLQFMGRKFPKSPTTPSLDNSESLETLWTATAKKPTPRPPGPWRKRPYLCYRNSSSLFRECCESPQDMCPIFGVICSSPKQSSPNRGLGHTLFTEGLAPRLEEKSFTLAQLQTVWAKPSLCSAAFGWHVYCFMILVYLNLGILVYQWYKSWYKQYIASWSWYS